MPVTVKRVEEISLMQEMPEKAAVDAAAAVNGFRREKHALICREADATHVLSQKNHNAKMLMLAELLRMGFSREAAERVLNVKIDPEETL